MPLDQVARRYADRLFQNSFEEIVAKTQADVAKVRLDHASRGAVTTGGFIAAHGKVYLDQIRLLGEAKVDSLLKASKPIREQVHHSMTPPWQRSSPN